MRVLPENRGMLRHRWGVDNDARLRMDRDPCYSVRRAGIPAAALSAPITLVVEFIRRRAPTSPARPACLAISRLRRSTANACAVQVYEVVRTANEIQQRDEGPATASAASSWAVSLSEASGRRRGTRPIVTGRVRSHGCRPRSHPGKRRCPDAAPRRARFLSQPSAIFESIVTFLVLCIVSSGGYSSTMRPTGRPTGRPVGNIPASAGDRLRPASCPPATLL